VLGEREAAVVKALASVEPRSFGLSAFQVDATARILAAVQRPRASGIVVAAGTGTGKTLAFYLPAMALIAIHIDETYWPKVVAMYPRVELLKDHCSQAAVEARRAIQFAREETKRLGQPAIGTEHILLGILRCQQSPAVKALNALGVTHHAAKACIQPTMASGTPFVTVACGNAEEIARWSRSGIVVPTRVDDAGYATADPADLAAAVDEATGSLNRLREQFATKYSLPPCP